MKIVADDIIELLPIVKDKGWYINYRGYIRDQDGRCPICSLLKETHNINRRLDAEFSWVSAGLPEKSFRSVLAVMNAADGAPGRLRNKMKIALGLK